MISLPPDAEYPVETFEWGLPAVLTFGKSIILLTLGKMLGHEKQSKFPLTKKSRTTYRICLKSFSLIQSAGVKNWVP